MTLDTLTVPQAAVVCTLLAAQAIVTGLMARKDSSNATWLVLLFCILDWEAFKRLTP